MVFSRHDKAMWKSVTDHVVISNATMISSFRIRAVNEMATMFKNSFSNRTRDMIIMAAPRNISCYSNLSKGEHTLVKTDH